MKAFLNTAMTAVCLCLTGLLPAWAANPLTRAEQTVCRNLSHCLSILDDHPHDSFDYEVLAREFTRFGDRGRKALIKRISQGDKAKDRSASHAADLVAIMQDKRFLAPLQALSARDQARNDNEGGHQLARRTYDALAARMRHVQTKKPLSERAAVCPEAAHASLAARKASMPYFELNVATPDISGAYRPSAKFQIDRPLSTREHLRSAIAVRGGWYAAYPDSLIFYDSRTGRPTLRMTGCFQSVLRQSTEAGATHIWAFRDDGKGGLQIMSVGPDTSKSVAKLPAALDALSRHQDGSLCMMTSGRATLSLLPDGTVRQTCSKDQMR